MFTKGKIMTTVVSLIMTGSMIGATFVSPAMASNQPQNMTTYKIATQAQKDALNKVLDDSAKLPQNQHKTGKINAAAADNVTLEAFGLPDRPDQQKDPQGYKNWMANYGAIKEIGTVTTTAGDIIHTPNFSPTINSSNWCGCVNKDNNLSSSVYHHTGYKEVYADIPVINEMYCSPQIIGTEAYYSPWVGLGGDDSNATSLLQVGLDLEYYYWESDPYAWTEVVGQHKYLSDGVTPNPFYEAPQTFISVNGKQTWVGLRDNFHMGTAIDDSNPNDPLMGYIMTDTTTGLSTGLKFIDLKDPVNAADDSADYISEAPTVSGSRAILANYGTQDFTNCYYYYGSSVGESGNTKEPGMLPNPLTSQGYAMGMNMYNTQGTVEDAKYNPPTSDTSFSTTWLSPQ